VTGRAAGVGEFGIDLRPPDPVTDPWGAGRAAEEGGPDQTNDYVDTAIDTIGGALPNVESIFDLSQNIGQNVPSPETTGYFSGGIEIPNFGNLPAVQALQGSVLNSLQNPDVISPEMQESLRGQAVDTILGGVRDTRRQVADEMARRGISDSGLATAVAQKGSRQATKDIQQAERDVAIQAALARRESELAAQQTAAALTGQLGQMGLGATNAEINRGQLGLQEYLGRSGVEMDAARLGLGAAQLETHILGAQAELEANRDVFVPNYMDEYTYNTMLDLMDRYHQDQLDEEERGFMWSIIGGLGQVFLPILAGVG
jgi:hypothetical protein